MTSNNRRRRRQRGLGGWFVAVPTSRTQAACSGGAMGGTAPGGPSRSPTGDFGNTAALAVPR
ncbi:MAG: hypothetical protein WCF33_10310, partial [Pseudonocardiaceae bacterium]